MSVGRAVVVIIAIVLVVPGRSVARPPFPRPTFFLADIDAYAGAREEL